MTDAEKHALQARLTPAEYEVLVLGGTEKMASGQYFRHFEPGRYHCKACGEPVFSALHKYPTYTGWASFYQPDSLEAVREVWDTEGPCFRIEATCGHCGAHLGHKFRDERSQTNWRYCINSLALDFFPETPPETLTDSTQMDNLTANMRNSREGERS
jgi:peptide-methionine (R)-S-oxide reductase